MDPLTGFVSIVGLISIFKQEGKTKENQSREAFFQWLDDHRHEDLKEFVLRSKELPSEIDRALQEDNEVIISKLESIDKILASLLCKVEGISGIAHVLHPNAEISDRAVSILRQLINSSSKEFGKIASMSGVYLMLTGGGNIVVKDIRFLDDDLNTLVNLGLLLPRYSSKGSEFFGVTRNAMKFVEAIDGEST
jgi:hypothetical protein